MGVATLFSHADIIKLHGDMFTLYLPNLFSVHYMQDTLYQRPGNYGNKRLINVTQ